MSASAAVVVRRTSYPQVDPRASGLMDRRLVMTPPSIPLGAAERLVRRRGARAIAARLGRRWGVASHQTLRHALRLGIADAPLDAVLWEAPAVAPDEPEVAVRRRLGPGTPFVLVADARGPRGVVATGPGAPRTLPLSATDALARLPEPAREVLRQAGAAGDRLGMRVAAVGGLVRDLFLGRAGVHVDVDLVVEGDARAVARGLAAALGGRAVEHGAFLTATVELPDGRRLDLATARRERYRAPGALPTVEPASLTEDLGRRDFALNAMALRLDREGWGALVDPTDGLADTRARRLRVLHPLSFVEDPTRILRAARLAVRLGCRVEPTTRRLARRAAALDAYGALSGDRLRAELELALAEPDPVAVLTEAVRLGVGPLVAPGARATPRGRLPAALGPVPNGPAGEPVETEPAGRERAPGRRGRRAAAGGDGSRLALAILAIWGADAERAATRLGLSPARRAAIRRAWAEAPELAAAVGAAAGPAEAYAILEGADELTVAWARALAPPDVREPLERRLGAWRALPALATGDDVVALGVPPGPAVGALLRRLRAIQAAGRVRTRADALRWLETAARRAAESGSTDTRPGERGG